MSVWPPSVSIMDAMAQLVGAASDILVVLKAILAELQAQGKKN